MIWHDGSLLPDEALRVGIDDRVFEHGLGLFETFRSWGGRAPLLGRHLERLRDSARELGIPLDGVRLPDEAAVGALLELSGPFPAPPRHPALPLKGGGFSDSEEGDTKNPPPLRGRAGWGVDSATGEGQGANGDALFRLTVTAGSATAKPIAWLAMKPLPHPERLPLFVRIGFGDPDPFVDRHKMLNYWTRRRIFELTQERGADESLLVTPGRERVREGTRNNVLFVPAGRPRTLATPSLQGPVLPGIMRRVALDFAAARGFAVEERDVDLRELLEAEAVFLTNSVRGVRPLGRLDDVSIRVDEAWNRTFAEDLPRYIRSLDEPLP